MADPTPAGCRTSRRCPIPDDPCGPDGPRPYCWEAGADQPYTDEDVELAARAYSRRRSTGAFDRGDFDSDYWAGVREGHRQTVRAVLDALAAAGRLVPPGSEVRDDWSVVFGPDDALDCSSEATARRRAERDGGTVEVRRIITTPWTPEVPRG